MASSGVSSCSEHCRSMALRHSGVASIFWKSWSCSAVTELQVRSVFHRVISGWTGCVALRRRIDLVKRFDQLPGAIKQTARDQDSEYDKHDVFHCRTVPRSQCREIYFRVRRRRYVRNGYPRTIANSGVLLNESPAHSELYYRWFHQTAEIAVSHAHQLSM